MGVVGSKGIASYMVKYLTKGMNDWAGMKDSGFSRRWSCSRNWPRYEKLTMEGTCTDSWKSVEWISDSRQQWLDKSDFEAYTDGEFASVGSDRAVAFVDLKVRRAFEKLGKGLISASNNAKKKLDAGSRGI